MEELDVCIQINMKGNTKIFSCKECNVTFSHKSSWTRHKRTMHGGELAILQCSHCNHTTRRRYDLNEHVRRRHPTAVQPVKGQKTKRQPPVFT
ncbi:MAG: hypothetical protein GY771_11845, partial [bacterium]|nr:hypothetical protein [bacterium]